MSGDYTRLNFDPKKGFSGVLKQQGRVSLDSDWNEPSEVVSLVHRLVVATLFRLTERERQRHRRRARRAALVLAAATGVGLVVWCRRPPPPPSSRRS
jgi:Family of unknown function (DUF6519)